MASCKVLGLDLSLTSTGVALPDGEPRTVEPDSDPRTEHRVIGLRDSLAELLVAHLPSVVVIEDLPRNVRFGGPALGMAHGAFFAAWADVALGPPPIVRVTPASLKKYATGKGNAGKPEMLVAAVRRLGYDGHDDNEADALFLRALVLDALGEPVVKMPESHREALAKVTLPAPFAGGVGEGATG